MPRTVIGVGCRVGGRLRGVRLVGDRRLARRIPPHIAVLRVRRRAADDLRMAVRENAARPPLRQLHHFKIV